MSLKAVVIFGAGVMSGCLLTRKMTRPPPVCPEPPAVSAKPPAVSDRPPAKHPPLLAGSVRLPARRPSSLRRRPAPVADSLNDNLCPSTASEYRQSHPEEDRLTCRCTPDAASYGTVWGTGVYTADSSICLAARHDGLLGETSREVTLYFRPGQAHYEGSESNGVRSEDYGSWESSYAFAP